MKHVDPAPLFVSVLTLLTAAPTLVAAQDFPNEPPLLAAPVRSIESILSQATGIPRASLEVVDAELVRRPYSGVELRLIKLHDAATGRPERVALDESLRAVDIDWLLEVEDEIRWQLFGTMQPGLHGKVSDAPASQVFDALVQLRVEEEQPDKAELERGLISEEELRTRAEAVKARTEERAEALLGQMGARHGFAVPGQRQVVGPFVELRLTAAALLELARDEDVLFVGPANEVEVLDIPTIPQALPSTQTQLAHGYSKGTGVKIAVLEGGQTHVPQSCFRVADRHVSTGGPVEHMTMSLGIIGNKYSGGSCNGSWQGYAPEASVLMANSGNYINSYNWARARGVNVVTMSWHPGSEETNGSLGSRDVFFDYWSTHYPYPSVFTSAGNQASSNAFASGKGYNFLGVGNVGNESDGAACDDSIMSSSSYRNPATTFGHREIPEIAAPGSQHQLLGGFFGGTSCATPVAASIASLVIGSNTSLKYWPEAVRAILLATANFQGTDGADYNPWADGRDGTGMLNAWYATLAAQTRTLGGSAAFYRAHDYGGLTSGDFNGGWFERDYKINVSGTSSKIRAAFTWNSETTTSSSVLRGDLDIYLYAPDGTLVASGTSWENNVEFLEHKPTMTGQYTLRTFGWSVPSNLSSHFGMAYTVHYQCL